MLDIDEVHLIHRTQSGDPEAFSPLVIKYQPRLYRHIHRRVTDAELAEDLTQEVWLKAFGGIKNFRGQSAFYSWVYRIAENVCLDHFRKQKHQHAIEPLHTLDPCRIRDTHPCPSRDVERAELREHLKNALAQLTPARRLVFRLYYINELPVKAIASRLKKSEGTIKTHLRNARKHLRELLTPYVSV